MINKAFAQCKKGSYLECSMLLKKAKKVIPDHPKNGVLDKLLSQNRGKMIDKGKAAYKSGDYSNAISYLTKAKLIIPGHSDNAKLDKLIGALKNKLK